MKRYKIPKIIEDSLCSLCYIRGSIFTVEKQGERIS